MNIQFTPTVTHREIGEIPGCITPEEPKTLLEEMGCCPHSTSDLYLDYTAKYQRGEFGSHGWDKLMKLLPAKKCLVCR